MNSSTLSKNKASSNITNSLNQKSFLESFLVADYLFVAILLLVLYFGTSVWRLIKSCLPIDPHLHQFCFVTGSNVPEKILSDPAYFDGIISETPVVSFMQTHSTLLLSLAIGVSVCALGYVIYCYWDYDIISKELSSPAGEDFVELSPTIPLDNSAALKPISDILRKLAIEPIKLDVKPVISEDFGNFLINNVPYAPTQNIVDIVDVATQQVTNIKTPFELEQLMPAFVQDPAEFMAPRFISHFLYLARQDTTLLNGSLVFKFEWITRLPSLEPLYVLKRNLNIFASYDFSNMFSSTEIFQHEITSFCKFFEKATAVLNAGATRELCLDLRLQGIYWLETFEPYSRLIEENYPDLGVLYTQVQTMVTLLSQYF